MRKAKIAALIIGGVSTCIFGGVFGVYATAPIVSSVAPSNDVKNIYEVENEELANVAAVTSIRTTAQTTTSKISESTFTYSVATTTAAYVTTSAVTNNAFTMSASFSGVSSRPSYMSNNSEVPTEAPTQADTEAPVYNYTEPETAPWTEPEIPVWTEPEAVAPTEEDIWYEPPVENPPEYANTPVIDPTEYNNDYVETVTPVVSDETISDLPISDEDYIILCNAVAHEAGCSWISTYDKALVVEVIMNRVYSPMYPNSIIDVLTQANQFSGSTSYIYLGDFSGYVSQDVKDAVSLFFSDPSSFSHGYFGFYGDGYRNYFY